MTQTDLFGWNKNENEGDGMEQTERIESMECNFLNALEALHQLSEAINCYIEARESFNQLSAYYGSEEWKRDFADDEAGLLPADLKRGVLSEDAVWNLLDEKRELIWRMREIAKEE